MTKTSNEPMQRKWMPWSAASLERRFRGGIRIPVATALLSRVPLTSRPTANAVHSPTPSTLTVNLRPSAAPLAAIRTAPGQPSAKVSTPEVLKTSHDSARGFGTELTLPVDSTWGRALAAQWTQISDLLRTEIESMPDRVRRLLRPRPSREIRPRYWIQMRFAEVEAVVEFVGICRYFAGE